MIYGSGIPGGVHKFIYIFYRLSRYRFIYKLIISCNLNFYLKSFIAKK